MVVMIVFGLMIVEANRRSDLLLDAGYSDDVGDPLEDDLDTVQNQYEVDNNTVTAQNLPIVEDPLATPNIAGNEKGVITRPFGTAFALTQFNLRYGFRSRMLGVWRASSGVRFGKKTFRA